VDINGAFERLALAMAPKQSRHDGSADLWLRQQLAEMKKVSLESVGHLRMTPDKMPALVDVGVILTGKSARHVARDLQVVMDKHPELAQKVGQVSFGGRGGNRESLVPNDLAALIEIIFLLPGSAAAKVRQSAAQIFVRHLGGDLSLIREVERMNHVQTFLRENEPEHPLRAFGEAVEASESPELKRKREETEMAELDVRLKKIAAEERCLLWQEKEAEARVAIALEDKKSAEARVAAALEEQQRANEARRISNLREWIQLSGSDGVVQMAAADRVAANDMLRTMALRGGGAAAGLGAAICIESFLREKGVEDVPRKRTDFGKAVLRVWRERHPAHDPPKKQVFVNGQEILANSYWAEHRDIVEEAYQRWGGRVRSEAAPSQDIRRHMRRAA